MPRNNVKQLLFKMSKAGEVERPSVASTATQVALLQSLVIPPDPDNHDNQIPSIRSADRPGGPWISKGYRLSQLSPLLRQAVPRFVSMRGSTMPLKHTKTTRLLPRLTATPVASISSGIGAAVEIADARTARFSTAPMRHTTGATTAFNASATCRWLRWGTCCGRSRS